METVIAKRQTSVRQILEPIILNISWAEISRDYFGKSRSWLYQKFTGFDGHSSTFVNRNGYWNYDYRLTSRILEKQNVKKLVDIGCGNGAFLEMFHKLSPGTKLAGLDLSHEMVLRSRERLPEADITEGDAEKMPFEDGAFDAVAVL